ncbi:MAG: hypothetical protein ACD_42C00444G0001, partial [uncultured bacterium]
MARIDIVPDGATTPLPITFLYYDDDQHQVLSVGPSGQVTQTLPDPIFSDQPKTQTCYATAISTATLTGGFITPAVIALITVDAAHDQTDRYQYDGAGSLTQHIDAEGYTTLTHTDMFGQQDKIALPINNTTPSLFINREFDHRGNQTKETKKTIAGQAIITTKTYANLHGLCTSATDGNGSTTTFVHAPRGVLLTSTDPLGNTTAFVHDAFSRQTLCTLPLGQQTAHIYIQESRTIITQKRDASSAHAVLSSTTIKTDAFDNEIIDQDAQGNSTQSFYNAANQRELMLDANDNQTIAHHDLRGLIIQTNFRQANPALFSETTQLTYTLSRHLCQLSQDTTRLNLNTTHVWNALAQECQTITASGNVRHIQYDRRGLATQHASILDTRVSDHPPAVIVENNYNGMQKQSATAQYSNHAVAGSHSEVIRCDDFGRPYQRIIDPKHLQLTHTTISDNANHVIAKTDPNGNTTYFVRDALGQLRFLINAKGGVIEHRYDANQQKIFTRQYLIGINTASLSAGMSMAAVEALLTTSNYDRHTRYFYDDQGNVRFQLNRKGAVVEKRYDLDGREIACIAYGTLITGDFSTLATADLIKQCAAIGNKTKDRATFRVLDAVGQERFIIRPNGAVIEKRFFATRNTVSVEINYATVLTDAEAIALLPLDEISKKLTLAPGLDRYQYWIVDGLNREHYYVNTQGGVRKTTYVGNTTQAACIIHFNTPLAAAVLTGDYATLLTTLSALTPSANDDVEITQYDPAERKIKRTNALGHVETWQYDGASRES